MSLYCTNCRSVVGAGEAVCGNCRNGFVSRLACGNCNKVVPSGNSFCPDCDRQVARRHHEIPLEALELPPLPPGISLERAHVPDTHVAGRFGARAVVSMNGDDADILTKMNQMVVLLHALAGEMTKFQGVADSTRRIIRGCRTLAADLQEEVEVRRGPSR